MINSENKQPTQIIQELTIARAKLGNRLSVPQSGRANTITSGVDPLPAALTMLGLSVAKYVRAQVSPTVIVQFAKRHPVIVSVGVAAALLTGPVRILNMIKKAVTYFGVASAGS